METVSPAFTHNQMMVESSLGNLVTICSALTQDSSPATLMRFNMTLNNANQQLGTLSTEVDKLEVDEYSHDGAEGFERAVTGSADRLVLAELGLLRALASGAGDNAEHVKDSVTQLHNDIESVVEKLRAKKTTDSTTIPGIDHQIAGAYETALAALG